VQAMAGYAHSAALTADGELFTWGRKDTYPGSHVAGGLGVGDSPTYTYTQAHALAHDDAAGVARDAPQDTTTCHDRLVPARVQAHHLHGARLLL